LRTRCATSKSEVILFDRLDRRQGCQLHQCSTLALKASIVLNVQDLLQEIPVAVILSRSPLCDGWPFASDTIKLEYVTQHGNSFLLQIHARASSNAL
jgi:hypothetical protein